MNPTLTPETFKQKILTKYPDGVASDGTPYSQMDATDLTQRIVNKYPTGVTSEGVKYADYLPKQPETAGGRSAHENSLLHKGLEFAFPILQRKERTGGQLAGDIALSALPFVPGLGVGGSLAAKAGTGLVGRALVRGAEGAALGYGADVASHLSKGDTGASVLKPGLGAVAGGTLGAGFGALGSVAPDVLSMTSQVPRKAFDIVAERPKAKELIETASPAKSRDVASNAIKTLRTNLSNLWKEGTQKIADETGGAGFSATGRLERGLTVLEDEFNIELPQNIKNISAKEGMELLARIRGVPEKYLTVSPKGATVREVVNLLGDKLRSTFGGKGGTLDTMYKEYTTKSGILEAADAIVKAYKKNNPIAITTAQKRLQSIFDDGKGEYLAAIQALEKETGVDILSEVAAGKFQPLMPRGKFDFELRDVLQLLAFPLSSPRTAGKVQGLLQSPILQRGAAVGGGLLGSRLNQ